MQKSSHPADSPDTKQVAIFQHPAWQPSDDRLAVWITWDASSGRWWFVCTFDTHAHARAARFRWDWQARQWVSDDAEIVASAIRYCNSSARAALAAANLNASIPYCEHGTSWDGSVRCFLCAAARRGLWQEVAAKRG